MISFTVKSFSKINLLLKILNKRRDNYHNLYSLFLELNHCDEIIFTKSNKFQLTCEGISVPSDKSNLIYKAYQLIKTRYKIDKSLSIHLKKKIPIFAGLGGGSSNAATTLVLLNKIWKLNLSTENLEKIGSELGADVPFFIKGGIQEVQGIGDILNPKIFSQKDQLFFLLVIPKISISTKWAYEKINKYLHRNKKDYKFIGSLKDYEWNLYSNDFEELVISAYPEIGKIKKDLLKSGAFFTSLSGSGSTMFGVYNDFSLASEAEKFFKSYQTIQSIPNIRKTPFGA
tara:strand:- start:162 stop:1019 length:858 start_codon:yes stop_codon:yes gene_type:complete